jgi:hypothetical protein
MQSGADMVGHLGDLNSFFFGTISTRWRGLAQETLPCTCHGSFSTLAISRYSHRRIGRPTFRQQRASQLDSTCLVGFYRSGPAQIYICTISTTMVTSDYDSEEWEDYDAEPRWWPKEEEYEDMEWTIENHHAVYSASVGRNIPIDDIFNVVDWKYCYQISTGLASAVRNEVYSYSAILFRFVRAQGVVDEKFKNIYTHFYDWEFDDLDICEAKPAAVDTRIKWETYDWGRRPSFDSLYEVVALRFWEKVLEGIDPVLAQMFPFYSFSEAGKFPEVIHQWWVIILKQFMEMFNCMERSIGMPPPPPQIDSASSSSLKQKLISSYFPRVV